MSYLPELEALHQWGNCTWASFQRQITEWESHRGDNTSWKIP